MHAGGSIAEAYYHKHKWRDLLGKFTHCDVSVSRVRLIVEPINAPAEETPHGKKVAASGAGAPAVKNVTNETKGRLSQYSPLVRTND